jgi:hypothetical protein
MKSPFPGMDPYLERHWRDVHSSLVIYSRDRLQSRLPGDLLARVEERVFVETEEGPYRAIYPDVHVVETFRRPQPPPAAAMETGIAVEDPLVVEFSDEPATQGYIEIVDAASGNRVITVIEFISPSNKMRGEGRDLYLKKRREGMQAGASLVEIDLTRDGYRDLPLPPRWIPRSHQTTYQAGAWRPWKPIQYEIYRVPLRQRLPSIRIPLRQTDADVPLDLQALVEQCYENGRYDSLDYRVSPEPPLDADDAAWADELLRAAGRR